MDAKQKIILATLDIIKSQGMRAIRHRAVAAKAQVSLGSTTYHFKDIGDLISSAFIYWHEQSDIDKKPYLVALRQSIDSLTSEELTKDSLANTLKQCGERYLRAQIFERSDELRIELAFHNEALRSVKLGELMLKSWQDETNRLESLFATLGIKHPMQCAESTFALIMQLEKKALLINDKDVQATQWEHMKKVFEQHIEMIVGVN